MSVTNYDLISPSDYENLPTDPEQCFLALEEICLRNLNRVVDGSTSSMFDEAIRKQYVVTVAAFAREAGIDEIVKASPVSLVSSEIEKFFLVVKAATAGIRFRTRASLKSNSVLLQQNTRARIEFHITRLRDVIESSDLSSERKTALCKRLEDLRGELNQPRLSFVKTFTVLSLILSGLAAATNISAEGPTAVTNIMRLVGIDQETEEAAAQRLMPPPKLLPAPAVNKTEPIVEKNSDWDTGPSNAIDVDVPF